MKKESNQEKGFNEVYDSYSEQLFDYAKRCTRNLEDAEDIFQETFFRYYMITQCEEIEFTKEWLATVVRNQAWNLYHAKQRIDLIGEAERFDEIGEQELDIEEDFFDKMWKKEKRAYTYEILRGLKGHSERWYRAVVMAYCMGIPGNKVAETLGMSRNALDCMLQRSKKWIKENYKEGFEKILR